MNDRRALLLIPLILFITTTVLVVVGILQEWYGDARGGIMLYCEHARDGYIKQPVNSISNFAFSLAGIYIAWSAYKGKFSAKNSMTETIYYALLMSCSMVILGAGSFVMHATNTAIGGFLDLFGMFMFSCFVSSYAIKRWFKLSDLSFFLIFVAGVSIGAYINLRLDEEHYWVLTGSTIWFAIHLLVATIFELMLHYVRKIEINAALGWTSIFILLLAFVIWNLSRTQESILCDPYLWLQGHAIWHILNAIGACFVFLFYTTDLGRVIDKSIPDARL